MNDERNHHHHDDDLAPHGPEDFPDSDDNIVDANLEIDESDQGTYTDDEAVANGPEDDFNESEAEWEPTGQAYNQDPPPTPPNSGRNYGAVPDDDGRPSKKRAALLALSITLGLGLFTAAGAWWLVGGVGGGGPSGAAVNQSMQDSAPTAAERQSNTEQAQISADAEAVEALQDQSGESSATMGSTPPAGAGLDEAAVIALIDERLGEAVEREIRPMDARFEAVDTALADLSGQITRLAEHVERSDDAPASMDTEAAEALNDRVEALETVVADLEGLRQDLASQVDAVADDLGSRLETLEISAEVTERLSLAPPSGESLIAPADPDAVEPEHAEAMDHHDEPSGHDEPAGASARSSLTGWALVAIGTNQAMIRSPSGETYRVQPGDRVEGLGTVHTIDPFEQIVDVGHGVIDGG